MAAKVAGSTTIIAVDVKPNRLSLASELGATHTINGAELDTVAEIQKIVPGGVNYTLETTAVPKVFHQAVEITRCPEYVALLVVLQWGRKHPWI